MTAWEALYLYGIVPVYAYCEHVHFKLPVTETLPFLPLMTMSLYCTVGVVYSWVLLYKHEICRTYDKVTVKRE